MVKNFMAYVPCDESIMRPVSVREGVEFEAAPNVSVLRERDRRWRRRHVALPAEVTSAL